MVVLPLMGLFGLSQRQEQPLTPAWARGATEFAEKREIPSRLPDLSEQIVCHMAPEPGYLDESFKQKGTKKLIHLALDADPDHMKPSTAGDLRVPAARERLPLASNSCHFVICSLATLSPGGVEATLKELARILKEGGKAILVDLHPFSPLNKSAVEITLSNKRPGFESYFKSLKEHALPIGNIREVFVEKDMKPFFKDAKEEKHFDEFHGTPLLLFFFVSKLKRKTP